MTDSISTAEFRAALSQFATGVTIVTADGPGGRVGFTATGFTSLSLDPPLVLVCVSKSASAYEGVVGADHFAVSILTEAQRAIAELFARHGADRFEETKVREGTRVPAPLIEDALVHLECVKHGEHHEGDHTILIGRVVAASVGSGPPLLHFARRFGAFVAAVLGEGR
ncbi:MAG TPA: flavin reductase family protein [Polyangiaceae bacterium]|jgi:flavin reductase (DIM6/NTAB) family NADH-FMN oxidoreductase RutF|nr:flavin reductase family protein [Polyangiaceae bacterium]